MQGQLLLGLKELHFHMQTLDKWDLCCLKEHPYDF